MEADLIDFIDPKGELRAQLRERRDQLSAAAAAAAAPSIAARLIDALTAIDPALLRSVALFSSFRSEVSTTPLAEILGERGSALAYPRVEGDNLVFTRVSDPTDLQPGRLGILEPPAVAPALVPPSLSTIVVPGLGFDLEGGRLGWGRGFYDRALVTHRRALRVAVAFECQIIDEVPTHDWDVAVDLIITEKQAIICPGADRDRS